MRLTAYPRLHVSLADMGFASPRSFGGIGFAIEHSPTIIDFELSDRFLIAGGGSLDFAARLDLDRLLNRLQTIRRIKPFRATILSHAPQHCGFGSKTALALSLVAGANHLCGLGLSRSEMQTLSSRGGASGIGIHSFFDGGVICDGGHPAVPGRTLLPSSAGDSAETPPLLSRLEFPPQWHVILLLGTAPPLSGEDEVAFFHQHAPIERHDALETIANLYHGVLPAFATADRRALASALTRLHSRGFKMQELARCDEPTQRCFKVLTKENFSAGISSVGPLMYVIVDKDDRLAIDRVNKTATDEGLTLLGSADGWNAGYHITGVLHET